jgi:hypothetical protein
MKPTEGNPMAPEAESPAASTGTGASGRLFDLVARAAAAAACETSTARLEAHGGRMWVESAPGRTTTFRFALPVFP